MFGHMGKYIHAKHNVAWCTTVQPRVSRNLTAKKVAKLRAVLPWPGTVVKPVSGNWTGRSDNPRLTGFQSSALGRLFNQRGQSVACEMLTCKTMKSVVFRAKKSGDFVEATLEPAKDRPKISFGLVDLVLIAAILLCSCGLVCLIIGK